MQIFYHNSVFESCIHCLVLNLEHVASYLQFVKRARLDLLKISSFAHQRSFFPKFSHLVFFRRYSSAAVSCGFAGWKRLTCACEAAVSSL